MTFIPKWNERISNKDVVGEDHLGIETAAATYQGDLLPGIITVTDHARYYSLYCWVLWRFIHDERYDGTMKQLRGVYFKRLELAHSLACYAHHLGGDYFSGVIGSRRSGAIWDEGDPIDLDQNVDRYFQHKLGGFGQYYVSSMQQMGLLGEKPDATHVYQLTERGVALAEAYQESIAETNYAQAIASDDVAVLEYERAHEYGNVACLCNDALRHGQDRDLLREALLRLEDGAEIKSWHHRRQLTLGMLMDMVSQADGLPFQDVLRSALYLQMFTEDRAYQPTDVFEMTFQRWQYVQVRQLYTSVLQILWSVFLNYLQYESVDEGITFEEFITWLRKHHKLDMFGMKFRDYVQSLLIKQGRQADWNDCADYLQSIEFETDALTLFNTQMKDKSFTVTQAMNMGIDIFLRFYRVYISQNEIWQEIGQSTQESHRLPMNDFFASIENYLNGEETFGDVVIWLYREYILAQHEYMAIRKLRQNQYDTFKFHYSDGRFYRVGKTYDQPLRHLALRLTNGLSMLIDVGLIEDSDGVYKLTSDGSIFLARIQDINGVD